MPKSNKKNSNEIVTIYDIAKLAKVNPSTVSRALTTPGRLNEKTEERIREAAKALNYRVNPFARALPTGRSKIIGVMIADISNPIFVNAVRGIEKVATRHGYTIVMGESQESASLETNVLSTFSIFVDGLIMVTTRVAEADIRAINKQKPVILLNREIRGITDVVPDLVPGIKDAVEHLHELGHKHIAYVEGPINSWMSKTRARIINQTATKLKMKITILGPHEPSIYGGEHAFDRIKGKGITAVIAYNDLVAIGILQAASAQGVKIPRDLSIIGFDNIFGSEFTTPPLTTISVPLKDIGELGAAELIRILDNPNEKQTNRSKLLKSALILRDSTAKAKAKN